MNKKLKIEQCAAPALTGGDGELDRNLYRLAELERDKARLDWLVDSLEVDMEINGAVPLDHIDYEAWNSQGGNECDATRTAWRNAIDSAMSDRQTKK
jgi:hypothetical protein